MFGIILAGIGAALNEVGSSIGKWEVEHHKETLPIMGFIQLFWGAVFFAIFGLVVKGSFVFNLASLPTFLPRVILEVICIHLALRATATAERSAIGFLTVGTIPLVLMADIVLGYAISPMQFGGIFVVAVGLLLLLINHGIKVRGIPYVVGFVVTSAATISLYKYDITYFNSVGAEQGIIYAILLSYFTLSVIVRNRKNPFVFLMRYPFSLQSIAHGGVGIVSSFAYTFAPASIIITARRAFGILSSVVSGKIYFHERHLLAKSAAFVLVMVGIVMLV
ncbi:MAG: hypothetical protein NUV53_00345 [Patescibacteria group bacterium]|nr:hypothetical protein [Patescibacteria group bacterium]